MARDTRLPSLNAASSNQALCVSDLEVKEQKGKVKHVCALKGHFQKALIAFSLRRRMC